VRNGAAEIEARVWGGVSTGKVWEGDIEVDRELLADRLVDVHVRDLPYLLEAHKLRDHEIGNQHARADRDKSALPAAPLMLRSRTAWHEGDWHQGAWYSGLGTVSVRVRKSSVILGYASSPLRLETKPSMGSTAARFCVWLIPMSCSNMCNDRVRLYDSTYES
jgi:hypothetical protein